MKNSAATDTFRFLGGMLAGTVLLVWPAFLNHYPFLFPDTIGYFIMFGNFRSIGYGYFVNWVSLKTSLWFVIIAQAWITSYLLLRIPRLFFLKNATLVALLMLTVLTTLTDLPIFASWIMPDIMSSWLFLASILLFSPSGKASYILATVILWVSLASHNSHVLIGIFFLVFLSCIRVCCKNFLGTALKQSFKRWAAALLGGLVFVCLLNGFSGYGFRPLSPEGARFLMGKFASNGILSETLRYYCPEKKWMTCKHHEEINSARPATDLFFLWNAASPFLKFGLFQNNTRECNDIVLSAFKRYPIKIARQSLLDTLELFRQCRTELQLRQMDTAHHDYSPIYSPRSWDRKLFKQSLQYNKIYVLKSMRSAGLGAFVYLCSLALLGTCVYFKKSNYVSLICGTILFIWVHHFVLASVGGCDPRYNMRVSWLLFYVLLIVGIALLRKEKKSENSKTNFADSSKVSCEGSSKP